MEDWFMKKLFIARLFDKCNRTTILIHSLSKSYAMTGWRIGAITAPKNLILKMQLCETTSSYLHLYKLHY